MAPRYPHFIDVGGNRLVRLQLVKANFDGGLGIELGITAANTEAGEVPAGKTLAGDGREAAMRLGCFGVNLVYVRTGTKKQTAKVLCSPAKSDTVFINAKGKTYGSKNIVDVRIPRRRIYSF
jgi:hypothetical protein